MDSLKQSVAGGASAFREDGAVGSNFKSDGALGSIGQGIGGPFDKKGAIGQQFTTEGSVGGNVQASAEKVSGNAASSSSDPTSAHRDPAVDDKYSSS